MNNTIKVGDLVRYKEGVFKEDYKCRPIGRVKAIGPIMVTLYDIPEFGLHCAPLNDIELSDIELSS